MATAPTRLLTAEEFFDWANRPENRDRHFELEGGEFVEVSRPEERHGVVCGNVAYLLGAYVRQLGKGYVCPNDTGLILKRDPDTVRGPDVLLYLQPKRFDDLQIKYTERMPELVVEVLSPNDKSNRIPRRITTFLNRGVKLVWIIDPDDRSIALHRANRPPLVLEETDVLENIDELPAFRCAVAELFRVVGEE